MAYSFLQDTGTFETKGYENFYSEDSTDVSVVEDEGEASEGITPSGALITDVMGSGSDESTIRGDNFISLAFGKDSRVFGMPFNYGPLADPLMRVYQSTFEADNNICFFTFGTPKINRALFMKLKADAKDPSTIWSVEGVGLNVISSLTTGNDPRLVSFKPNFREFWHYASVTANYLYTMMDLPGVFDWDDFYNKEDDSSAGVPFFVTKQTSVSEGLTNAYTQSGIVETANGKAAEARNNYQMYGTYGDVSDQDGNTLNFLRNIQQGLGEKISEAIADAPIIGGVASVFMKANRGSMQFYADLWQDSKTDNSYQLSFKFTSPYGNKLDIFRNIYFPWALLYTAALPRQDGKYAYKEPFLIQVRFPGWFTIECGLIESMQWNKGGENSLWSAEGLPLEMTVNLSVRDLYPIQMSSEKLTRLKYNRGLLAFLENMAGINTAQLQARTFSDKIKADIKLFESKALDGGYGGILSPRTWSNLGKDVTSSIGQWMHTN